MNFPDNHKISPEAIDFIKCLLTRDITSRIGYGDKNFQRLMSHPWFVGIPWDRLESKQAEPPFVPDVITKYSIVKIFINLNIYISIE